MGAVATGAAGAAGLGAAGAAGATGLGAAGAAGATGLGAPGTAGRVGTCSGMVGVMRGALGGTGRAGAAGAIGTVAAARGAEGGTGAPGTAGRGGMGAVGAAGAAGRGGTGAAGATGRGAVGGTGRGGVGGRGGVLITSVKSGAAKADFLLYCIFFLLLQAENTHMRHFFHFSGQRGVQLPLFCTTARYKDGRPPGVSGCCQESSGCTPVRRNKCRSVRAASISLYNPGLMPPVSFHG